MRNYDVDLVCGNCFEATEFQFKYAEKVSDTIKELACPYCGVKGMMRNQIDEVQE
jgi:DNA-directed RNA polymerase subunit RPC12/RpoP